METVTHDSRETAYRLSDRGGDGGGVLFVHGSGATHEVWKSQFRLGDERPVGAIDLSGHGESSGVLADPGWGLFSAYVDDVLAVAEAMDARYLVGNSMGGAVVLQALLERDPSVDGVGLVGTGARLAVLEDLLFWLREDYERAVDFLHGADRLFHDADPAVVNVSREAMWSVGQPVTSRDYHSCHEFDVRDRLDEVAVPALAICGEHDQLTPPWYHEFLAEGIPDGELRIIDDAAHLVMLERPDAFNEALSSFLSRLDG